MIFFKKKLSWLSYVLPVQVISFDPYVQEMDLLLKGGLTIDSKNQINSKTNKAITCGEIYMGEYRTAKFTATTYKYKSKRERIVVPTGPPLAT